MSRASHYNTRHVSLNRWMQTLYLKPAQPDASPRLMDLTLPGAHDAATCTLTHKNLFRSYSQSKWMRLLLKSSWFAKRFAVPMARTQHPGTLYDQLCMGVRFFDFRAGGKDLCFKHGDVYWGGRPLLTRAFTEALAFFETNRWEFVIFHFSHFKFGSDAELQSLLDLMVELFGDRLVRIRENVLDQTYYSLVQQKQRNILLVFDTDATLSDTKGVLHRSKDVYHSVYEPSVQRSYSALIDHAKRHITTVHPVFHNIQLHYQYKTNAKDVLGKLKLKKKPAMTAFADQALENCGSVGIHLDHKTGLNQRVIGGLLTNQQTPGSILSFDYITETDVLAIVRHLAQK
jgi:hypothetical protein